MVKLRSARYLTGGIDNPDPNDYIYW